MNVYCEQFIFSVTAVIYFNHMYKNSSFSMSLIPYYLLMQIHDLTFCAQKYTWVRKNHLPNLVTLLLILAFFDNLERYILWDCLRLLSHRKVKIFHLYYRIKLKSANRKNLISMNRFHNKHNYKTEISHKMSPFLFSRHESVISKAKFIHSRKHLFFGIILFRVYEKWKCLFWQAKVDNSYWHLYILIPPKRISLHGCWDKCGCWRYVVMQSNHIYFYV